jgi:rhodanese-related sulfurtransferase
MSFITAEAWTSKMSQNGLLVDVRTPLEFSGEHAQGAINLPLDQLNPDALKDEAETKSIGLICQSGARAQKAAQTCEEKGLEVYVLEGGTQAWVKANLPTVKGKSVISLERQVRIAAGFLVLAGVVISKLGFVGAEYISAFVGAGLMFAGITDTCGMGLMMAKMPWNQKACSKSC